MFKESKIKGMLQKRKEMEEWRKKAQDGYWQKAIIRVLHACKMSPYN